MSQMREFLLVLLTFGLVKGDEWWKTSYWGRKRLYRWRRQQQRKKRKKAKETKMSEIQPLSMASEPCCSTNCPCKEEKEAK